MKRRLSLAALLVVIAGVVLLSHSRRSNDSAPNQTPAIVSSDGAAIVAPIEPAAKGRTVVIQTGAARLDAVHASDKPILMRWAGLLFFQDCLMTKITNGMITVTSNELRQDYSSAVAQLYTNGAPAELDRGFDVALRYRNNLHVSLDDNYQRMEQYPALAPTLKKMDKAIQNAGIIDADQSDLKSMCLAMDETKTTAYAIYGPQSDAPMASEYAACADTLDRVLIWRLTNIYGLDDEAAQSLVRAVSRISVQGFSGAGLQVPAYIQ